jgi:hypothetical protein
MENTVHTRQMSICLSKMARIVGLSLRDGKGRVRHLPTREHIRATIVYPPANLPTGEKPYPYPHPTDIRGYRVYPSSVAAAPSLSRIVGPFLAGLDLGRVGRERRSPSKLLAGDSKGWERRSEGSVASSVASVARVPGRREAGGGGQGTVGELDRECRASS